MVNGLWRGGGWPPFLSRPYPVFPNGTKIATKKDKKGQKRTKILALFRTLFYLIFDASAIC